MSPSKTGYDFDMSPFPRAALALALVGCAVPACRPRPQPAPVPTMPPAPPAPATPMPTGGEPAPSAAPPAPAPAGTTPAPQPAAPEPAAQKPPAPDPPAPQPAPTVEVDEPSFVGDGTVPDVEKFLTKMSKTAAKCVADHGGLSAREGEVKLQFLVTVRTKAEGVEVLSKKGVSEAAAKCMRDAIRGKSVGMPTADPTGVQFRYLFTKTG